MFLTLTRIFEGSVCRGGKGGEGAGVRRDDEPFLLRKREKMEGSRVGKIGFLSFGF